MAGCPRLSVFWPFWGVRREKFHFLPQFSRDYNMKNQDCEKKF